MPEIILETRRAEARRVMEGEVWQKKREAAAQVLRRRREEAQLAMEGHERRSKRQAAVAAARAQTETRAAIRNAEDEKQKAARQTAESAVETERRRAAEAAAAAAGRQRQAQTTSQTINRLKARPVEMSPIRTLKTDLAQAASTGATLTQAIIREQGRETASGSSASANVPKSYRGWLAILVPILLLLGGAALVYIYYWPTTIAPPSSETIADPDEKLFLLTDERVEIENLNQSRETITLKLRQALNDGVVSADRVTRLIPTEAARPLTLKPWLERLSISLPEKLIQPLEPKFLLGRYDDIDSPTAFLMLKTKSYEASFSGLRQNEKSLIDLFYRLTGRPALAPATTTPIFTDQLRHNIETRQIKQDDKTILLYAFLDQSTIVLAENENALEEILNRRNAY